VVSAVKLTIDCAKDSVLDADAVVPLELGHSLSSSLATWRRLGRGIARTMVGRERAPRGIDCERGLSKNNLMRGLCCVNPRIF